MDNSLKNIIRLTNKGTMFSFICYLLLIVSLIFVIIGATTKIAIAYVFYILGALFVILSIFLFIYFLSKVKKEIKTNLKDIDFLAKDIDRILQKIYISPLTNFKRINQACINLLGTIQDYQLLESYKKPKNINVIFETERLYVRQLLPIDVDTIYEYRNNKEINYYQTYDCFSKKEIAHMIENNKEKNLLSDIALFSIVLKENNKMIGELFISNKRKDDKYFVGFTINKPFQRNGYAYEIISDLLVNVESLQNNTNFVCTVYDKNIASLNLIKKLEFKQTKSFEGKKGNVLFFEKRYN